MGIQYNKVINKEILEKLDLLNEEYIKEENRLAYSFCKYKYGEKSTEKRLKEKIELLETVATLCKIKPLNEREKGKLKLALGATNFIGKKVEYVEATELEMKALLEKADGHFTIDVKGKRICFTIPYSDGYVVEVPKLAFILFARV